MLASSQLTTEPIHIKHVKRFELGEIRPLCYHIFKIEYELMVSLLSNS